MRCFRTALRWANGSLYRFTCDLLVSSGCSCLGVFIGFATAFLYRSQMSTALRFPVGTDGRRLLVLHIIVLFWPRAVTVSHASPLLHTVERIFFLRLVYIA